MGNYANGSVGESYGMIYTTKKNSSFALRTSSATTTLRIVCTRVVTSSVWIRIPTGESLRASTTTTTTLRTTLARMATLATPAVGMSRIPTEYNENRYTRISIPIYFSILL